MAIIMKMIIKVKINMSMIMITTMTMMIFVFCIYPGLEPVSTLNKARSCYISNIYPTYI